MKQQPIQKSSARHRAAAQNNASGRRKLIIVFLLFIIMGVLWLRVFLGKNGPKTASAVGGANEVNAVQSKTQKVIYTELPVIAGRHDVLEKDVFAAKDLKGFRKQGESFFVNETDVSDETGAVGDLATAAEKLELTAIVNDKKPQVFIEDQLLEKGQSFRFVFSGKVYNFKVVNILADRVELDCNGVIITKKIPEYLNND